MRSLNYLNAGLWFLNAILWTFYAGSLFMGITCLITAAVTGYLGWSEQ